MGKGGASRGRPGKKGRDASARRPLKPGARPAAKSPAAKPRPKQTAAASPPLTEPAPPSGPFRLGAVPGATPGKWIDAWHERMPGVGFELISVAAADQRRALVDGEVDAAVVRLPLQGDGFHVIALYDEVPVVVTAAESHLTAADELSLADLAGEILIVPADDVLGIRVPGTVAPAFAPPADTGEAIATVAAGVGIVVVPMSLARLHRRKDVDYRPLRDGPPSRVALAWLADRTTTSVETFVGIVRGRTENSSRG
ncbi:MAG: LysR substrate-binding domain-containing protein [Microbacterium sp.]